MIYRVLIKPFFDKSLALFLLLVLLVVFGPLILICSIIYPGSLFFTQSRSGLNMKPFTIFKIRTLKPSIYDDLSLKKREYTLFGKFLRVNGFDEIPQLWNILKGEMSFIGPRPLPVEYDMHYGDEVKNRFSCRPGITGLAQVMGRNDISWPRRFFLDSYYASNYTFQMDLRIVIMTCVFLLKRQQETQMPVLDRSFSLSQ